MREAALIEPLSRLTVTAATAAGACLLKVSGTLDSNTYLELRNTVIKAALDEPPAVLVDVSELNVPASSAWSVFTSARWHVSTWPDVPILLVCPRQDVAARIARVGAARYVAVHADVESAMRSVACGQHPRRRARIALPHAQSSLRGSRNFVAERLVHWSLAPLVPTAKVIVDVFVDNVLLHTDSAPVVLLENAGSTVTIAVQDNSVFPAVRHEATDGSTDQASGLAVVSSLSRTWGSSPAPNGKTVWAVLGPENLL
ncbi:STAS domain-containing protein [Mycolicibacter minnesotensis]